MIPKRELTQEQIEEIQALRGRLSAGEVKKRFGIGSTRLYKIWRDEASATDCNIHPGMEIVRGRGCPPRFPFELFWEQQKAYDSGPEKRV